MQEATVKALWGERKRRREGRGNDGSQRSSLAWPLRCLSATQAITRTRCLDLFRPRGFIRHTARATRWLSLFSELLNFNYNREMGGCRGKRGWGTDGRRKKRGERRRGGARGLVLFSRVLKTFSFKTNEQGKTPPLRLHASTTTALLLANLHFLFMHLFIFLLLHEDRDYFYCLVDF